MRGRGRPLPRGRALAGRGAWSLVEILVVLAILTLASLPVALLFRGQTAQAYQAGSLLACHSLLMERMDRLVSRLHATRFDLEEGDRPEIDHALDWGKGQVQVAEKTRIERCQAPRGLWRIELALCWRERRGSRSIQRRLALTRLVADPAVGLDTPDYPADEPPEYDPDDEDRFNEPPIRENGGADGFESGGDAGEDEKPGAGPAKDPWKDESVW